jgi:hypothetical protein
MPKFGSSRAFVFFEKSTDLYLAGGVGRGALRINWALKKFKA